MIKSFESSKTYSLNIQSFYYYLILSKFFYKSVYLFSKKIGEDYLSLNLKNTNSRETSPNTNSNPEDFSFPSVALAAIVLALSFYITGCRYCRRF